MDISSIGSSPVTRLQGSTAINQPNASTTDRLATTGDTVQISTSARYLSALKQMPAIRQSKVNAAKLAIAAGTYDTPHVLDGTVSKLMGELR